MDVNVLLVICSIYVIAMGIAEAERHNPAGTLDPHGEFVKSNFEETKELLQRLESNEKLIRQLLGRVEYLETREREQQLEIQSLRQELGLQKIRTSVFEKVIRRQAIKRRSFPDKVMDYSQATIENGTKAAASKAVRVEDNEKQSRIRQVENESPIAFFAALTYAVEHAGVNQILVFDHAITNLGNAYNNHNGNFIAPVDGTYLFSVTLMSLSKPGAHAQFFKNGIVVSTMFVSGGYYTSSQTLILQLRKGDDVSVHNVDADASIAGGHYSSFAGFLLQETYTSPAFVRK